MDDFDAGQQFVSDWHENVARLEGTYDPSQEHDACGVGLVAALDGRKRRDVVLAGIDALRAVWHRGAVDADGKTGDGAGIHIEIPQDFFADVVERGGDKVQAGTLAVGMVFLPKTEFGAQERCRQIVETEILDFGYTIYGWRQVPINDELMALFDEFDIWSKPAESYVLLREGRAWLNGEQAKVLRTFCDKIQIRSVCFHALRACWATQLLNTGLEASKVMKMGGWSDWETMMR